MAALATNFYVTNSDIQPIPKSPVDIPIPEAKTAGAVGATVPPFALNHARILYDNKLIGSVLSGDDTRANAVKPNTYETWNFAGNNSNFIASMPALTDVDTICLGGHNIGATGGGSARVYWDDDDTGSLTPIETRVIAPGDPDDPIMFHFDTTYNAKRIQVDVFTSNTNLKQVAYVSAGVALQMQRPFFGGHTPITDGDVTEYYSSRTQSGNIIGQQIRRQGYETSNSWKNIDDTWYRSYFAPFKQMAKTMPFFMAWNLSEYPDDVGFCRISQDISAPYAGTLKLRTIDFKTLGV